MEIDTTRFGRIELSGDGVLTVPNGVFGFEDCRRWVTLDEATNPAVVWLQSVDRPDLAFALVSPRRFVPGYQVHVARRDLAPLGQFSAENLEVLVIVSRPGARLALNLKAPLVIDAVRGVGCQVVARDDWPVRYEVGSSRPQRRVA